MNRTTMVPIDREIVYPETDGKPVGETDIHIQELLDTLATLKDFFRDQPNIYVSGDNMFYYEERDPSAVVSPDIYVVKGIAKGLRRIYKLWVEKIPPCFVLEITSRSSRLEDLGTKRAIYALLGVREYFLFDPTEEYLEPPLQGFILVNNEYQHLEPDADGSFISQELGLNLRIDNNQLRFFIPSTGEKLLRPLELAEAHRRSEKQVQLEIQARRLAEQQAQWETAARRKAELEIERLQAELQRLREK